MSLNATDFAGDLMRGQLVDTNENITTRFVGLYYIPTQPYSIHMTIHLDDVNITWTFARDLLADGIEATCLNAAGIGDVYIYVNPERRVCIGLDGIEGEATVELPYAKVSRFLRRTYKLVPDGAENLDIDAGLERLLDGAA